MARIHFRNRQGQRLSGELELPPGGTFRATALFAHCFTCTKNSKAARYITRTLAERGIAVLRFDFTGLGESEGDFAETTFASNVTDIEDAAQWLGSELGAPQLLIGHSLGGAAVLAAAVRLQGVRAVATISAPADPAHILSHLGGSLEQIEKEGKAEVQLGVQKVCIGRQFIEDVRSQSIEDQLQQLRAALLVMHSPRDTIVGIEHAERIYRHARHPKSFVSLDRADHLLADEDDARFAAEVIDAWARRYLVLEPVEASEGARVLGRRDHGFLCAVQAGTHRLIADEPKSHDGTDRGPDPYRFLAASLGSCTVMTLNMYARHKGWPVERVVCEVVHDRVHAEDCEGCESGARKIDRLTRRIAIEGELDEAQRRRMIEIADRCPVHRTLSGEIRIETVAG
ncbi:MAG: bifunctional alpha/beta hydrolase/OsmC family protein [Wenzhouxiangellaceae bacterium]